MLLLGCGYAGYALHVAGGSGFLCALVLSLSLHGLRWSWPEADQRSCVLRLQPDLLRAGRWHGQALR